MTNATNEPFMTSRDHPDEWVIGRTIDGCLLGLFAFHREAGLDPLAEAERLLQSKGFSGVRPEFIDMVKGMIPSLQSYTFNEERIRMDGRPLAQTDDGEKFEAIVKSRTEEYAKHLASLLEGALRRHR